MESHEKKRPDEDIKDKSQVGDYFSDSIRQRFSRLGAMHQVLFAVALSALLFSFVSFKNNIYKVADPSVVPSWDLVITTPLHSSDEINSQFTHAEAIGKLKALESRYENLVKTIEFEVHANSIDLDIFDKIAELKLLIDTSRQMIGVLEELYPTYLSLPGHLPSIEDPTISELDRSAIELPKNIDTIGKLLDEITYGLIYSTNCVTESGFLLPFISSANAAESRKIGNKAPKYKLSIRDFIAGFIILILSVVYVVCVIVQFRSTSRANAKKAEDLVKTLNGFFIGIGTTFMQ